MHGGLSPELKDLELINEIQRPCEVPDEGLMSDLVWSDPDTDIQGWEDSDRGVSFLFGEDVVKDFLEKHELELIVRAHQVVEDGYEFFFDRKLVTLFSAPNYCGEFDNCGAIMTVNNEMVCSFKLLKPIPKKKFVASEKRVSRMSVSRPVSDPKRLSFGRVSLNDLTEAEIRVDRKSYFHKSFFDGDGDAPNRSSIGGTTISTASSFSVIQFAPDPPKIIEIEDITKRTTTWGDIWEDLFYDADELAEFKYAAYDEMLAEEEANNNY
jgi:hypothetical protein